MNKLFLALIIFFTLACVSQTALVEETKITYPNEVIPTSTPRIRLTKTNDPEKNIPDLNKFMPTYDDFGIYKTYYPNKAEEFDKSRQNIDYLSTDSDDQICNGYIAADYQNPDILICIAYFSDLTALNKLQNHLDELMQDINLRPNDIYQVSDKYLFPQSIRGQKYDETGYIILFFTFDHFFVKADIVRTPENFADTADLLEILCASIYEKLQQ